MPPSSLPEIPGATGACPRRATPAARTRPNTATSPTPASDHPEVRRRDSRQVRPHPDDDPVDILPIAESSADDTLIFRTAPSAVDLAHVAEDDAPSDT
jgi:hypothetical protein